MVTVSPITTGLTGGNGATYETVDVMTFIGRMVQHTMSKGFRRIRYYGVQATKTLPR